MDSAKFPPLAHYSGGPFSTIMIICDQEAYNLRIGEITLDSFSLNKTCAVRSMLPWRVKIIFLRRDSAPRKLESLL